MPQDLNDRLYELIQQAGSSINSKERRQRLNQIIAIMQQSGQIWRGGNVSREIYQDALAQTWEWFCRNLDRYNPERAKVLTWFNNQLANNIRQALRQTSKERSQHQREDEANLISEIPEPAVNQLDLIATRFLLEQIQHWVQQNRHRLRQKSMRNRPDIHAERLILSRLPREVAPQVFVHATWQDLALEYQVSDQELRRFFQRSVLPLLQPYLSSLGIERSEAS